MITYRVKYTGIAMVYIFSYFLISLLGVIEIFFPNKLTIKSIFKKYTIKSICFYYATIIIILSLIAAFRADSVGADTISYSDVFLRAVDGQSIEVISFHHLNMEEGFIWFAKFVAKFTSSRTLFFFVVSCITNSGIIYFIHNNARSPVLPIQTYVALQYLTTLNIMRQYLAISLVLISFVKFEKKKTSLAIILYVVAFLLHNSVILLLPYLFFKIIRNKRKLVLYSDFLLAIGGVLLLNRSVLYRVLTILGRGHFINSKYLGAAENNLGIIKYVYLAILLMGVGIYYSFPRKLNDKYYLCLVMASFATVFSFLAERYTLISRVSESYLIFIDILFAYSLEIVLKDAKSRQLAYLVASFVLVIPLIRYASGYIYRIYG